MTREEAIEHIKDIICENNTIAPSIVIFKQEKEALDMAIKALDQTSWIPCSERLPEERAYYLITVKIDGMNGCKPYYEIQTSWYSDKQFVVEYIGDGLVARRSVIAWMPLPQPYKAERENQ